LYLGLLNKKIPAEHTDETEKRSGVAQAPVPHHIYTMSPPAPKNGSTATIKKKKSGTK
jgi:hypothetical protein